MVRWVQWLLLAGLLQISVVCIFLLAPGLLSARLYALQELLVYPGDRFYDGSAEGCLTNSRHRHAVVTSLRSAAYLPLLQGMAGSLQRTNPGLTLLILVVSKELPPAVEAQAGALGTLLPVQDVALASRNEFEDSRFNLNWIKLRAWELRDWDALLWVDADTAIAGSLAAAFELPAHFAVTLDVARTHRRYSSMGKMQAGIFMLRPCPATAAHMLQLLAADPRLHFAHDHAEQDFLDWYFKTDRLALPAEWNYPAHLQQPADDRGWLTASGRQPKIVHFTDAKPWTVDPQLPGHSFLLPAAV